MSSQSFINQATGVVSYISLKKRMNCKWQFTFWGCI